MIEVTVFVLNSDFSSMPLRTQVRPAIESVSGKEGLRPRNAVLLVFLLLCCTTLRYGYSSSSSSSTGSP